MDLDIDAYELRLIHAAIHTRLSAIQGTLSKHSITKDTRQVYETLLADLLKVNEKIQIACNDNPLLPGQ